MSMHTQQAARAFNDMKAYVTPEADPVEFNLASGLSALTKAIAHLEHEIDQLKHLVETVKRRQ
ncbi:MAG: hypothetical protein IT459_23410 [Planctomycetes bacterium]|nr:hypothetical protein [Planctomycetota bacterium]